MNCTVWDSDTHQVPLCFRDFYLGEVIPAILVLLYLTHDLICCVPSGKRLVKRICKPFSQLIDVDAVVGEKDEIPLPRWKHVALVLLSIGVLATTAYIPITLLADEVDHQRILSASILVIVWTYALVQTTWNKPITPSYRLLSLYTTLMVSCSLQLFYGHGILASIQLTLSLLLFGITLTLPLYPSVPRSTSKKYAIPAINDLSPESRLNLWEYWTYSWMNPLLNLAKGKSLEDEEVWNLMPELLHRNVYRAVMEVKGSTLLWQLLRANIQDLTVGPCFSICT